MGKEPGLIEAGRAYPDKAADSKKSSIAWAAISLLFLACNGVIGGLLFSSYSTLETSCNEKIALLEIQGGQLTDRIAQLEQSDMVLRYNIDQLLEISEVSNMSLTSFLTTPTIIKKSLRCSEKMPETSAW